MQKKEVYVWHRLSKLGGPDISGAYSLDGLLLSLSCAVPLEAVPLEGGHSHWLCPLASKNASEQDSLRHARRATRPYSL